jgi:hypothetical protein
VFITAVFGGECTSSVLLKDFDQMRVQSAGPPVRPVVSRLPMVGPCWPMGVMGGIWSCISAAAIFRFGRDSSGL